MKILDAEAAVGNVWDKLKNIPVWDASKVREAQAHPYLGHSWDLCHLQRSKLATHLQKTEDESFFEETVPKTKTNQDEKQYPQNKAHQRLN